METEVQLALTEIRDLLRKRRYKAALSKTQRVISSPQIHAYSVKSKFRLLILQLSAVHKIIQRNMMKKYKYDWLVVQGLLDIIRRNVTQLHDMLCFLLEETGEKVKERERGAQGVDFPLVEGRPTAKHMKLQKLQHVFRKQEVNSTRKLVQQFMTTVNQSILNFVQMGILYRRDLSWKNIQQWSHIPSKAFTTHKGRLSHAKFLLLLGKMLSLDSSSCLEQAQRALNQSIQELIDCLHSVNQICYRIQQENKLRKYRQLQKECFKLLIIALIMINKNNMKLGREQVATFGCQIIKGFTKKLGQGYGFFKRLLQPQIYLHQQFQRYRGQKKQLSQISNLYFNDLLLKEQCQKQQNRLLLRPTKKPTQPQQKPMQQISTIKTISHTTFKRKGNSCLSNGHRNNSHDSKQMGDTIITKMIVSHIQDLNKGYKMAIQNIGTGSYYRAIRNQHIHIGRKKVQSTLRRHRAGASGNIRNQEFTQRQQRVQLQEFINKRDTQNAKSQLKNRQKFNLLPKNMEYSQQEPAMHQVQKQIQNGKQQNNILKYTEQNSFQQDENEHKWKFLKITKKTKVFVEILFMNKQALGLKKVVQKFQLLKKKQQQKQKMMSNRVPSAVNRDRTQVLRNMHNFKFIAEQLLKAHEDRTAAQDKKLSDEMEKKRMISANYALGQDSIQAIKSKIQTRLDQQEGFGHTSDRNQQIFKQKLKRLGSSNFFLKRAPDGKNITASLSTRQSGKVQFLQLPLDSC